ncbi:hypothetical protein DL768_010770 [Monosporascus sp. mg162]|nr:hypothetical protein DL768_010770 [Monosporascus sp. mg162]
MLNSVGKIDMEGIFDAVSPLPSPSSVAGLPRLVNNAELLLTREFVNTVRPLLRAFDRIDLEGIVDQMAPLITPESVKGAVIVPSNAESVLISAFVSQTTELAGHATPVSSPLVQSTHYPVPAFESAGGYAC